MDFITKQEIIQALKHLGQLAESCGEQIELVTVGGALMLLACSHATNHTKKPTEGRDMVCRAT
ncbi:MAG: hypothetical protein DRR08_17115 [Candidatus Parabeggiatoa sp. nov. 2]|nr:MAG: hypothetical protein B6247_23860 [Beggiatoa sp. 4572_84]RKZ58151.1 MAG: hypothetical protein DRR08_17115 [Gammaproteobacteria bacterium]